MATLSFYARGVSQTANNAYVNILNTNTVPVTVQSVEWLGADAYGYCVIDNSDTRLTVRMPGNAVAKRGDRLQISLAASGLHFFSRTDGRRL